jgi:starvation-inducible DNA-binding protein
MAKKAKDVSAKTTAKAVKAPADGLNIGLSAENRGQIVAILNALLADEFTLYARARAFHWNVTGRHFKTDHALFEDEYEFLDDTIDEVAERARALGGFANATLSDYLKGARVKEVAAHGLTAEAMIRHMLEGHEAVIRTLREDVETVDDLDDEGTTDFLTGLMEAHEKRAWMLRSHLTA